MACLCLARSNGKEKKSWQIRNWKISFDKVILRPQMWDKHGLVFLTQIFWLWFQMHSQQHPPNLKDLRSDRWTAPARDAPVVLSGWRACHLGVSDACHLGSVAGWDLGGASPRGERDSVMRCHCVPKPSINGAHVVFMSVKQTWASCQGRRVRMAPLFDRAGDELQSPLSACLVWRWAAALLPEKATSTFVLVRYWQ